MDDPFEGLDLGIDLDGIDVEVDPGTVGNENVPRELTAALGSQGPPRTTIQQFNADSRTEIEGFEAPVRNRLILPRPDLDEILSDIENFRVHVGAEETETAPNIYQNQSFFPQQPNQSLFPFQQNQSLFPPQQNQSLFPSQQNQSLFPPQQNQSLFPPQQQHHAGNGGMSIFDGLDPSQMFQRHQQAQPRAMEDPYLYTQPPVPAEAAEPDPFQSEFPAQFEESRQQAMDTVQIEQALSAALGSPENDQNSGNIGGPSRTIQKNPFKSRRRVTKKPINQGPGPWTEQELEVVRKFLDQPITKALPLIIKDLRAIKSKKSVTNVRSKHRELREEFRRAAIRHWAPEEEQVVSNHMHLKFGAAIDAIQASLTMLGYERSDQAIRYKLKHMESGTKIPKLPGVKKPRYYVPERIMQLIDQHANSVTSEKAAAAKPGMKALREKVLAVDARFPVMALPRYVKKRFRKKGEPWSNHSMEDENEAKELIHLHGKKNVTSIARMIWVNSAKPLPQYHSAYVVLFHKVKQMEVYGDFAAWTEHELNTLKAEVEKEEARGSVVDWQRVKHPLIGRSIKSCMRQYELYCRPLWTREKTHALLKLVDGILKGMNLIQGRDIEESVYSMKFTMIQWPIVAGSIEGTNPLVCELRYRAVRDVYLGAKTDPEDDYIQD